MIERYPNRLGRDAVWNTARALYGVTTRGRTDVDRRDVLMPAVTSQYATASITPTP